MRKINLLIISSEYNINCGVSRYVSNLIKWLSEEDLYNVHLIINGGDAVNGIPLPASKIRIIKYKEGITNLAYFPLNFIQLLSYCLKNDIHIIHSNHRYPEFVAWLVSKMLDISTVSTLHSIVAKYKLISFRSDILIAVSGFVRNHVALNYGIPNEKIKILYNALSDMKRAGSDEITEMKKKLNISNDSLVLLFAGQLIPRKGYDIIISAVIKLLNEGENITLILMTNAKDEMPDKNIYSYEQIKILKANEDMSLIYGISDIVVVPSRMDPFPFVMLEAGYYNKLLIASDVGGIHDFIEDNINGLLFPVEDTAMLTDKIRWALNNKEKRDIISRNLHQKVMQYCNRVNYIRELKEIYNKVILK